MRPVILAGFILGVLVTLAGAAIFWDTWDQTRWVKVDGTVLESEIVRRVERSAGETGSRQHWTLGIRYAYVVGGQRLTGDRYSSRPPRSPSEHDKEPSAELRELLARYPVGASIPVWVDPKQPGEALLDPFNRPSWAILAVGLALLFASLAGWALQRGR